MSNKITKIEAEWNDKELVDITFYFEGSDNPFGISEFKPESNTRMMLENIESEIYLLSQITESNE